MDEIGIYDDDFYDIEEDESFNLDDTTEYSENDTQTELDVTNETNIVEVLRDELLKRESDREYLRFRYKGEVHDGIPMAEINPSRFVFKIDDMLQGINLSEIKIL